MSVTATTISPATTRVAPLASPSTLAPAEIAHFVQHGYVTVRQAIPADDAARMLDDTWAVFARRGIVRDDRATWPGKYDVPRELKQHATFDRLASPRLFGAIDDLSGAGTWNKQGKGWGLLRVTFPERTTLPWELSNGWHWDCAPSNTHAGIFAFIHIGETVPGGGGTLMVAGSPRVFAHRYARRAMKPGKRVHTRDLVRDHPWFMRLPAVDERTAKIEEFMHRSTIDADGHELRVVESTGMPGDVRLCHPTMYHSGSLNRAHLPRIMRFCSFALNSERPVAGTPMAAAVSPLA
jgi:hypothetical protein